MEKKREYCLALTILALLPTGLMAAQNCNFSSELTEFIEDVQVITGEISTKVLGLKVNYDGTGTVKVLTDEAGNLLGVRLDYKDSKGHLMQQTRTVEEFNKGEAVSFVMEGKKHDPLILKTKPGTVLSKVHGGSFTFSLLTDDDPVKYVPYQLSLLKVGSAWKVTKDDKAISSTTISPNISWSMEWEGTFKSASFQ
jgi:hypothetical protein